MYIEDAVTSPLPRLIRDPLLLLLEAQEARRRWVVRLLTWANYHVYAPDTVTEAVTWFMQHPIAPQAMLIGELDPREQEMTKLLFLRYAVQDDGQVPIIILVDDGAPAHSLTNEAPFAPDARQGLDLLETLWQDVPRHL